MSFIADYNKDFKTWDYILGDLKLDMSIAKDRYYYLEELSEENNLKISLRDPFTDNWTKWVPFPGLLWETEWSYYGGIKYSRLTPAIDVHRSILPNEIVIESDYPTYDENYEAARLIGKIIEDKGFQPLYYYSGNKSIHIHVFLDWDCFKDIDELVKDQLKLKFNGSFLRFKKKFIEWLRAKMIHCWDTNAKKFDEDLIKPTHLIRCELSKNKLGYKTFIGYSYKDLSFVPYVCNENNRIYPKLGKLKFSSPNNPQELAEEFIDFINTKRKISKAQRKNMSLNNWGVSDSPDKLRECVKAILSKDFKDYGDGLKRGMFILVNELKRVLGVDQARLVINDWNSKMDFQVPEKEIDYRLKTKIYNLSCTYIHKFLEELGIDISKKCKGKVYK